MKDTEKSRKTAREYRDANKLSGKVALITDGDSGTNRAVAIAFANEGGDSPLTHLNAFPAPSDSSYVTAMFYTTTEARSSTAELGTTLVRIER